MLPDKNDCYGCEACATICSHGAIKMVFDKEGFTYSSTDLNKCINCGLCEIMCPRINNSSVDMENIGTINTYAIKRKDVNKLKESSSGGVCASISEEFINNEGYVCGVVFDDDFKGAHYICTNKLEELERIKGSKYVQSSINNIYQEIIDHLKENHKILFVGTSCQVAAIKAVVPEKLHNNLYTIDIICHGPTSALALKKYIKKIEKENGAKIYKFSMRNKENGWTPASIRIELSDGHVVNNTLYGSDFGIAFKILQRLSCYNCQFKGNRRNTDLLVGDFWGLKDDDSRYDRNGVSAVIAYTEKGRSLICTMNDCIISDASLDEIIQGNPMIIHKLQKSKIRSIYSFVFRHVGIGAAGLSYRLLSKFIK